MPIPIGGSQFPPGYATANFNGAEASRNADATMSRINMSNPRVAIWVPGTEQRGQIPPEFAAAMNDGRTSIVALDYPADQRFSTGSVGSGTETMKQVMSRLAAEGKEIVVGAHSQGAWVAGEALQDGNASRKVSKAVLYGHPSVASAQYGSSGRIREVNNPDDPYSNFMPEGARLVDGWSQLQVGAGGDPAVQAAIVQAGPQNGPVLAELAARPFGGRSHAYFFDMK